MRRKACAELAIASHVRCFFDDNSGVKIVSARAGNVIGVAIGAKTASYLIA